MALTMKGGTSGNREDALPKVTVPFDRQEMQDTAGNGGLSGALHLSPCRDNRHIEGTPQVPAGGTPDDGAV